MRHVTLVSLLTFSLFLLRCSDDSSPPQSDGAAVDAAVVDQGSDSSQPDQGEDSAPDAASEASAAESGADLPPADSQAADMDEPDSGTDLASDDGSADDLGSADTTPADLTPLDLGCIPDCTDKECGDNGCGGSCGACAYGCVVDLCRRNISVGSIVLPCGLCSDFASGNPDPYVRLTLTDGTTHDSPVVADNSCGGTLAVNWSVSSIPADQLTNATFEIWDKDGATAGDDDLCLSWTGDFSQLGAGTVTAAQGARLSYFVSK